MPSSKSEFPYELNQAQLDHMYDLLATISRKAGALAERLANRDADRLGGRIEDMLHDAHYLGSFIPYATRQDEMTSLDRGDQVAT